MDNEQNNSLEQNDIQNLSTSKTRFTRRNVTLSFLVLSMLAIGIATTLKISQNTLNTQDELIAASEEEQLDPRFAEADDTVFDYGSIPTDNVVDTTTYDLPTVQESLSKEFENVVNTSPIYANLDSIYEILEWDDIDKDGDIKEEKMIEIINAAKGANL